MAKIHNISCKQIHKHITIQQIHIKVLYRTIESYSLLPLKKEKWSGDAKLLLTTLADKHRVPA